MKNLLNLRDLSIDYDDGSHERFTVDIYQPQWTAGSKEQESIEEIVLPTNCTVTSVSHGRSCR